MEKSALLRVQGPLFWAIAGLTVYTAMAVYLVGPYWCQWPACQYLRPVCMVMAGMGVLVLSRRWIYSGLGSLLAGAVYGFGPASIHLSESHYVMAIIAGILPWVFCPAVYVPRWLETNQHLARRIPGLGYIEGLLYTLPFGLVIMVAVVAHQYTIEVRQIRFIDWICWLAPVTVRQDALPAGVYHVSLTALIIGISMLIKAKRWQVMIVLIGPLAFASWPVTSFYYAAVWLCVASVWACVIVGVGIEGLFWAGLPDRRWLVMAMIFALSLAFGALAYAYYLTRTDPTRSIDEWIYTFSMYGIAVAWLALILAVVLVRERWIGLRQAITAFAIGIDLVASSRIIVDRLF